MYTPDREPNPPCCYSVDIDMADCVLCLDEIELKEANEIGGSLEYLCDKCERRVEEMDDDEVDDFVDERLTGKEILKSVIKNNNHEIKQNNEQK